MRRVRAPLVVRPGDRVRFEGQGVTPAVGMSGVLVRLADEQGWGSAMHLPTLMVSPGFEVLGSAGRPRRLPAGLLDALPPGEAEKVLWWHRHMTELLTALPPDARPERRPVLATIRRPRTWQLARRPRQPNCRR